MMAVSMRVGGDRGAYSVMETEEHMRGKCSKERDGEREQWLYVFFLSFVSANSPLHTPSDFLESGSIGFGFQFGVIHAFIYLFIHQVVTEHLLAFTFCAFFLTCETETNRVFMILSDVICLKNSRAHEQSQVSWHHTIGEGSRNGEEELRLFLPIRPSSLPSLSPPLHCPLNHS